MTPQLQQAIRLLQLSTLDLRQEIQQAVESNPLLELADDFGDDSLPEHDEERQDEELDTERDDALEELVQDEPGAETEWDDVYSGQTSSATASLPDDADEWQQRHAVSGNLQDHLLWQLNLTPMSDVDRIIAMTIIESLDDRGYITVPLDDIVDMVNAQPELLTEGDELERDEVLAVQHRLQQFDPVGVASIDLADCLGVQLRQLPADTALRDEACALLAHLDLLEKHDYAALRRTLQTSEDVLLEALSLLRTLDPAPGEQIGEPQVDYASTTTSFPGSICNSNTPTSPAPPAVKTGNICAIVFRKPNGSSRACRAAMTPCSRWPPASSMCNKGSSIMAMKP